MSEHECNPCTSTPFSGRFLIREPPVGRNACAELLQKEILTGNPAFLEGVPSESTWLLDNHLLDGFSSLGRQGEAQALLAPVKLHVEPEICLGFGV